MKTKLSQGYDMTIFQAIIIFDIVIQKHIIT